MTHRLLAAFAFWICIVAPIYAQIAGFTGQSDGHSWRQATLANRTEFCRATTAAFAEKGTRVSDRVLFDAIQEFYTSEDAEVLKQKLFDMAATLAYAASQKPQANALHIQEAIRQEPDEGAQHAQSLPRVVRSTETRPAIFEKDKIPTTNLALRGVDAKWSNFGMYLQKMVEMIQVEFDKLNGEARIDPSSGSMVSVKFVLNFQGKIIRIISIENHGTSGTAQVCTKTITTPMPFGRWTDQMRDMLGDEQEITLDFYCR